MKLITGLYSDGTERRYANNDDMLRLLGIKRLPTEAMSERLIQGVRVYVKPAINNRLLGYRKSSKHRIMIICPCGTHVSAGRMHQHKCKEVA